MTKVEILNRKKRIVDYLKQNRLHDAFLELKYLSESAMVWEISDEVENVEKSYRLMLDYAMQGAEDPARNSFYSEIINIVYNLLDRIVRHLLSLNEATLYYNTLRYEQLHPNDSISRLIKSYKLVIEKTSIYNLITSNSDSKSALETIKSKEELERRIFNRIWTTFPLKSEDEEVLKEMILADSLPQEVLELMLSALLLGMIEFYDQKRFRLLLYAYQSENEIISVKALVAILISMHIYGQYINDTKLVNQLETIKDTPLWNSDIKTAYLEFVKTKDTERISRKMQEELIPEMLKLRPDVYKKLNDSTALIDLSSMEENPEWEELLQNSGIVDKIKELNDLQEEGSDVFMSTFSHLKSYPFFSEIANWFLPFTVENSLVSETLGSDVTLVGDIIKNAPYLCNSDKYSFLLSLGTIPQNQRQLMLSQFEQQRQLMKDAGESVSEMTKSNQRKNIMNKYLQDLYRFFKLFRRKGEFFDPFRMPMNLLNFPLLSKDLDDVDTLTLVAEFYFRRKYYKEALDVFLSISDKIPPSAPIFQKIGYCYQQEGDIINALKYYEQSELLKSDSLWTLRRIGACYRALNQPQKALLYFERVLSYSPDDLNATINIGHCYLELGEYKDAIKNYYKVEFLDEKSTKSWRPLAWCLLLAGEYEQSKVYYEKVLSENPTKEDFLNMGHLYLTQGQMQIAIEYYKKYINQCEGDTKDLINALNADEKYLIEMGVDISLIPFLIDALLYSIDK